MSKKFLNEDSNLSKLENEFRELQEMFIGNDQDEGIVQKINDLFSENGLLGSLDDSLVNNINELFGDGDNSLQKNINALTDPYNPDTMVSKFNALIASLSGQ